MDDEARDQLLQNLECRTARIEQFLPTLPTRVETHAAIAEAVAPLPTRVEMHAAIAEAVAPLATREELRRAIAPLATREEMCRAIREEGVQTRHQMEVLFESLRDDIRIIAEGHAGLTSRVSSLERRVDGDIGALDLRVTALEHRAEP